MLLQMDSSFDGDTTSTANSSVGDTTGTTSSSDGDTTGTANRSDGDTTSTARFAFDSKTSANISTDYNRSDEKCFISKSIARVGHCLSTDKEKVFKHNALCETCC